MTFVRWPRLWTQAYAIVLGVAMVNTSAAQASACGFDVDQNSIALPHTDALILLRYLRGVTDANALVGAAGSSASGNGAAIVERIRFAKTKWDINGDGYVDAATDGLIITRYLLGLRDGALDANVTAPGIPTRTGTALAAHIEAGCPLASPASVCTSPISLIDTSTQIPRVGDGTPASCTAAALQSAVNAGGIVRFNCGPNPVTIAITSTINVPINLNTVIDGEHRVTLDGGGTTRILRLFQNNYRTNSNGLTLQRITLANGRAQGTGYVPPSTTNPLCAYGFAGGSGGAIEVRDARLHVIDSLFLNNHAATPGPDVGGGAIYSLGSLDLTVVGTRFIGNSGSNAGAVGLLQTNGRFFNSTFERNESNGVGQNYASAEVASCPGVGHPGQGGAGGNGGAIAIDGSDDTDQIFCGTRFTQNTSNELAGAIFRTANVASRLTTLDRSEFRGNRAKQGGALFISNSQPLNIVRSAFIDNSASSMGAAQFARSRLNIENTTFAGNSASNGLGGAIFHGDTTANSSIRNVTFVNNQITGGAGLFSAAIAGAINFPITNTVFANNTTNDIFNPVNCWFTPAASGSNNVQWPRKRGTSNIDDTACVNGIVFADPQLGAVGANGGPTASAVPNAGSPLIGAGGNCPGIDQRGQPRNTATCTIGAVEP